MKRTKTHHDYPTVSAASARSPASSAATIRSTSYTHPPHVPPPIRCSAAHRRVSAGRSLSGFKSVLPGRRARIAAPSSGVHVRCPSPTPPPPPTTSFRSTTTRPVSPSRSFPLGPPASASGPTCPMHAPVLTPENRASVTTATSRPHLRNLSADVIWYVSSIPEP